MQMFILWEEMMLSYFNSSQKEEDNYKHLNSYKL